LEVNQMAKLKPGDTAPDFELSDQNGKTRKLADYRGRKLLIYFYPQADTPGCTTQACGIRSSMNELLDVDILPIGISPDTPEVQKLFDDKYCLGFPLLSDADHRVADAYGVWGEKTTYGNRMEGIIRSAFIVDEDGRILDAFYRITPEETVPFALEVVEGAKKK